MSNVLKISEAASLAIHTMVLLAAYPESLFSTRQIASTLYVSEAHLSKVLQRLVKVGFVKSIRGPKGGFILEKSGDAITLLDVYESIEGPFMTTNCLLSNQICGGKECILGGLVEKINNQFSKYLSSKRLSELTRTYKSKNFKNVQAKLKEKLQLTY